MVTNVVVNGGNTGLQSAPAFYQALTLETVKLLTAALVITGTFLLWLL